MSNAPKMANYDENLINNIGCGVKLFDTGQIIFGCANYRRKTGFWKPTIHLCNTQMGLLLSESAGNAVRNGIKYMRTRLPDVECSPLYWICICEHGSGKEVGLLALCSRGTQKFVRVTE